MARTNIQVIISVKDGATKPLEKVQKGIKNTGKAAKDATSNIWQFNKTLFSTFAFVGLFTKGFSSLKESLMIGAELDKVSTQFERQIGPKSKFISALEGSTNVVIDEMTALRNGLELGNLGITKSVEDAALTIAKFGVAGKLAGKDASSVIDGLTQAVTRGNVAKLEELGIMKASDPAFMALMAITGKAGGVMGGTIAKQQAMAIVMGAINKRVQGQMFAFMSLGEIIEYTGTAYGNLKRNVGVLLANAMRPLLEKLLPLIQSFNKIVDAITRTDKETMFLVKTVLGLTAGITGLFASLGTLQLIVKLLGFTPFGFGGMAFAVLAVTAAFVGLTRAADGPLGKLKIFGAFFKGIYELVENFDPETGMSKISAATEKLLSDNGILGFVDFIAASIVTVKTALKDIVDFVKWSAVKVDSLVGSIFGSINDGLKGTQKWTTWWTTDTLSNFDKIKRAAMLLGGIIGSIFIGKKLFGAAGGLLSKMPVIGGMFGGKGPKGTPTDPIYTASVGGILGSVAGSSSGIFSVLKGFFSTSIVSRAAQFTTYLAQLALTLGLTFPRTFKALFVLFSRLGTAMPTVAKVFGLLGRSILTIVPILTTAQGALAVFGAWFIGKFIGGLIDDVLNKYTQGQTKDGFQGNIVERGLFSLFGSDEDKKRFAANKARENQTPNDEIKSLNEFRKKQGKDAMTAEQEARMRQDIANRGKQTAISVPTPAVDDEATIQALGEQMKLMDQSNRDKMQQAIEGAMKSPANGGGFIDPEEFSTFQNMLTDAFDGSKNLQELVNEAKNKRTALRSNQRG